MNLSLPEPVAQFLAIGGPVVWIHVFMSLLLLTVVLIKLWQFAAAGMFSARAGWRADRILDHWERGEHAQALDEAGSATDPQTRLLRHTAQHLQAGVLRGKALTDELTREAAVTLHALRGHLHSIELIAGLAPLLGLLGTVLGMIEAFQAMEAAGRQVDPSTLSGGIWKALLTTAVGLVVAIPAIVAHNWLERHIERFAAALDDRVVRMLTAAQCAMGSPSVAVMERRRARA